MLMIVTPSVRSGYPIPMRAPLARLTALHSGCTLEGREQVPSTTEHRAGHPSFPAQPFLFLSVLTVSQSFLLSFPFYNKSVLFFSHSTGARAAHLVLAPPCGHQQAGVDGGPDAHDVEQRCVHLQQHGGGWEGRFGAAG